MARRRDAGRPAPASRRTCIDPARLSAPHPTLRATFPASRRRGNQSATSPMIAFILRRLLASIGVLIAVGLIAFAMFRYVGDPVNQMVGIETSVQEREQLRHQLGLDQPTIIQAARFLINAARFDFGVSYQFKQPVADLIGARMPATLELALVASILSLAAG